MRRPFQQLPLTSNWLPTWSTWRPKRRRSWNETSRCCLRSRSSACPISPCIPTTKRSVRPRNSKCRWSCSKENCNSSSCKERQGRKTRLTQLKGGVEAAVNLQGRNKGDSMIHLVLYHRHNMEGILLTKFWELHLKISQVMCLGTWNLKSPCLGQLTPIILLLSSILIRKYWESKCYLVTKMESTHR